LLPVRWAPMPSNSAMAATLDSVTSAEAVSLPMRCSAAQCVGQQRPGDAAASTVGPHGDQPYPWQPGDHRDPQQTDVLAGLCRHGVVRRVQRGKNQDFGRHVLPSGAGGHLVANRAVQGA
jgi:hypothetical protein